MPPKKAGKGKKGQKEEDNKYLKPVEKEFYEIEIQELNRRIARLTTKCNDLEVENEKVRAAMEKMDEDRGDIISHLKRALQRKVDEIEELIDRIDALSQAKETENSMFKEKIRSMEADFKAMHEQLTSEIKLLNGKLNSLEEFRANREDLMQKFENQEAAMEEQEKRHDKQIFEMEQAFLIRKERLREEMEARLLKLSLDFQKATQMKIASTTQSVIRENIAVNNELNILVAEFKDLSTELESLKVNNKTLSLDAALNKEYSKSVERKNFLQKKLIEKLTMEQCNTKSALQDLDQSKRLIRRMECLLELEKKEKLKAEQKVSVLRQELHESQVALKNMKLGIYDLETHAFHLEKVIKNAVKVVKQIVNLSVYAYEERISVKKGELIKTLEDILDAGIVVDKYKSNIEIPTSMKVSEELIAVRGPSQMMRERAVDGKEGDELKGMDEQKSNYICYLEQVILKALSLLKQLKQLLYPPDVKIPLLKKEAEEQRTYLIECLETMLDLKNLIRTARPQPWPSMDSLDEYDPKKEEEVVEIISSSLEAIEHCKDQTYESPVHPSPKEQPDSLFKLDKP